MGALIVSTASNELVLVQPLILLLFIVIDMGFIALSMLQERCLSDLEADHLNSYEATDRLNRMAIPEIIFHAAFCFALFLSAFFVSGFWFLFVATLLVTLFNFWKYMKEEHHIHVTEIFGVLKTEKKQRRMKLMFYAVLGAILILSFIISIFYSLKQQGELGKAIII